MVEPAKSLSGVLNGKEKESGEVKADKEGVDNGLVEEEEESDEYDEEGVDDAEWEGEDGDDAEGEDDYEEYEEEEDKERGLTALLLGKGDAVEEEEEEEEEDEEYAEDGNAAEDIGIGKKRGIDQVAGEIDQVTGDADGENGSKKPKV